MPPDAPPEHPAPSRSDGRLAILFAGLLAGIVITAFAIVFLAESLTWDWKTLTGSENPNLIEAWRNLGLIALGAIGIGLATWRSILAHQQNQNAIAQRRISERGMNVDRYQKGAQMLESDELSVRIAGISGLRELALSDPDESYIIVQSLLFAFIRERSKARRVKTWKATPGGAKRLHPIYDPLGADIHEALTATTTLREAVPNAKHLEESHKWRPDLQSANLSGAVLSGANLSGARLSRADLSGAKLRKANLSGARLFSTKLLDADLFKVDISRATIVNITTIAKTRVPQIWAWRDRPPIGIIPSQIAKAITYRNPAERDEND